MRLVHIGFGKTATTSLQKIFFPYLSKKLDILLIDPLSYHENASSKKVKNSILENCYYKTLSKNLDNFNILYSKYQINLSNLPINIVELDTEYDREVY